MVKKCCIAVAMVIFFILIPFVKWEYRVFAADTTPVPITTTPTTTVSITPSPKISTTPVPTEGSLTSTPQPTRSIVPSPTPTPFVENTIDTQPIQPAPTITPTPTPHPIVVASLSITPTPPVKLKNTLVNFPRDFLSYIAPKDAYGSSALSPAVSLELLFIGCAWIVGGIIIFRWGEADALSRDIQHMGLILRSRLL